MADRTGVRAPASPQKNNPSEMRGYFLTESPINNKEACASVSRFRIPPFRFRVYHLTATKPPNSEYKYLYLIERRCFETIFLIKPSCIPSFCKSAACFSFDMPYLLNLLASVLNLGKGVLLFVVV